MKQKTFMTISLLAFLIGACKPPAPQYGIENNADRKSIGLPEIPNNWTVTLVTDGESTWINPVGEESMKKRIPVHWSKYLKYPQDTLISETDTYYGSQDYTTVDGTFREELNITYYYVVEEGSEAKSRWRISLWSEQTMRTGKTEISLEQAEKILKEWGIARVTVSSTPRP